MKKLLEKQEKLKREFNGLLFEYAEFQDYYRGRSPEEAENYFYSEMFELSGHDVWYEGAFSLEYTPLVVRMKQNREERKVIAQKLKEVKQEIKQFNHAKK